MEIVLPKNCVELSRTELITTNGGNSTSGDPNFIGLVGGGIKITGGGVAAFLFGSWIGGVIDGICIDITGYSIGGLGTRSYQVSRDFLVSSYDHVVNALKNAMDSIQNQINSNGVDVEWRINYTIW